jgi:membrane protein implicated in regulation of membrane protease activity
MAMMFGIWWVWLSVALALALVEIVLPGFIFLGFAIGAAALAVIVAVIGMPFGAPVAVALFAGLSLIAWIALRVIFRNQRSGARIIRHDIND